MDNWEYKDCYIDFASKYYDISLAMKDRDHWIAANYLQQLLIMSPNDGDLYCMMGKSLSYLKLNKQADIYYDKGIALKPESFSIHESYGRHLLHTKQSRLALQQFQICLKLKPGEQQNPGFAQAMAKCFDYKTLTQCKI